MLILKRKQIGMTITELMVGLVVGMLLMGGITSVYLSTIKSSSSTLNASRLNQEMSAIMNIMANDIRRAAYWNGGVKANPKNNPFSQAGSTELSVQTNSSGSYADAGATGSGSCIVYAYDLDKDGTLDTSPSEGFGFRWDGSGNAVLMKTGYTEVQDCTDTGETWVALSDTSTVSITNLDFDLANSSCLNTSEPNNSPESGSGTELFEERDCYNASYAADAGEVTVEDREVLITLSAQLVSDANVKLTMKQRVDVRNDHIQEQ